MPNPFLTPDVKRGQPPVAAEENQSVRAPLRAMQLGGMPQGLQRLVTSVGTVIRGGGGGTTIIGNTTTLVMPAHGHRDVWDGGSLNTGFAGTD